MHIINLTKLTYAISIYKGQGSAFSAVIIPIFMQYFTLFQRYLLYTAIRLHVLKNYVYLLDSQKL